MMKEQNIDLCAINTGGHISMNSRKGKPKIKNSAGFAKASPNFEKLEPEEEITDKEKEKKVIAESTIDERK